MEYEFVTYAKWLEIQRAKNLERPYVPFSPESILAYGYWQEVERQDKINGLKAKLES
jgi:hypothetical protein